jgi:serine/threonine-protein kinase
MKGLHSPGEILAQRYRIIKYTAEGGMQYVYQAYDEILHRDVALKTPKNYSSEKRFNNSAIVSARVNHPNVAKTYDYFEENGKPYLIEEFVHGADISYALLRISKYLDPYLTAKIFHYLAKGLASSHHVGVIHRDIKPSNIMITDGFHLSSIKITDFGIAKMADEELTVAAEGGNESIAASQTALGALPYMAPEAIESPRLAGTASDIWSLGALIFKLLTGLEPYGIGLKAVRNILEANEPNFPPFVFANQHFSALSKQLSELIISCLQKDPRLRPTADELADHCSALCYPIAERFIGKIKLIKYDSWGFISTEADDVFFHLDSVYGEKPIVGDSVMFSKYPGGSAWRSHPVVKIYS